VGAPRQMFGNPDKSDGRLTPGSHLADFQTD
jgi:hypothetical protein